MAPFFTWAFMNLVVLVLTHWVYSMWSATQQTYKEATRGGRHHQRPDDEKFWVVGGAVALLNALLFLTGFFT